MAKPEPVMEYQGSEHIPPLLQEQQESKPKERLEALGREYLAVSERKLFAEILLKDIKVRLKEIEEERICCLNEMKLPMMQILFPEKDVK